MTGKQTDREARSAELTIPKAEWLKNLPVVLQAGVSEVCRQNDMAQTATLRE